MLKIIPENKEQYCLDEIIRFFAQERDEEIGIIAAGEVYDFFIDQLAPLAYNEWVLSAKKVFEEKCEDLKLDFDMLSRSL